ncbi:MAG: zinc-dependent peptidase [Deltaproteobacteria bacterium]|nr:zinc-dependent peptidase [Deltaproteobacteria bacterium]
MFAWLKRRRRARLRATPLPNDWRAIVARNVPYAARLAEAPRAALDGCMQIFLAEKRFEGCGGLTITDEIRVTIAAQACILLVGRPDADVYPTFETILVYPHAYVAAATARNPDGTVSEAGQARLGEAWARGPVVLSWDDVVGGATDARDGHNVVFHEFAHQLDNEATGPGDGAPALPRRSLYVAWARVLGAEYARLIDDVAHHRHTVLDGYGATSPAEFFAVATECFFEKPEPLRRRHPALYEQLQVFYQQDPAAPSP